MKFLRNQESPQHTPEYNQLHECYGHPLDYVYREMAIKKPLIQKLLLLLMNNITARSETTANEIDKLTFMLNYNKVDILAPHTQEEIYKGFNEFKDTFPIWLHENTMYIANPAVLFWHYLVKDDCSTESIKPFTEQFKEHIDKEHLEHGFPLDYAISNKKVDLVNLLLFYNMRNTRRYIISNDKITQQCLAHIGKIDILFLMNDKEGNEETPTIFLQPADKEYRFSDD